MRASGLLFNPRLVPLFVPLSAGCTPGRRSWIVFLIHAATSLSVSFDLRTVNKPRLQVQAMRETVQYTVEEL